MRQRQNRAALSLGRICPAILVTTRVGQYSCSTGTRVEQALLTLSTAERCSVLVKIDSGAMRLCSNNAPSRSPYAKLKTCAAADD